MGHIQSVQWVSRWIKYEKSLSSTIGGLRGEAVLIYQNNPQLVRREIYRSIASSSRYPTKVSELTVGIFHRYKLILYQSRKEQMSASKRLSSQFTEQFQLTLLSLLKKSTKHSAVNGRLARRSKRYTSFISTEITRRLVE